MSALADFFQLKKRGSSVSTEARGAVATFLTMSYILFVNPQILAAAGVPQKSAIACTAAAAAICCLLMGLTANFPVALASGMGLNAIVAYQIAGETGSWQVAMGLIVLDGIIILLLVLLGLREAVMNAIPLDLRRAIGVGIGLFIAFIGAVNAKLVIVPGGTLAALAANPTAAMPPVTYGTLRNPEAIVGLAGILITAWLMSRRVKGAILLGIVISTMLALVLGVAKFPAAASLAMVPDFSNAFKADILGALKVRYLPLLVAFLMVDFFDSLGTVTAIADQSGLDKGGEIPRLRRILSVDGISASVGGLFGASSVTAYIESAAGVAEGARTGLHTVFVGVLFILAMFFAPVIGIVPAAATAPALILVGFLMCAEIGRIDFKSPDIGIPAFLTIALLPLTYSISHGVGYGFIAFTAIRILSGRFREVHPLMYVVSAAFAAYFIWGVA